MYKLTDKQDTAEQVLLKDCISGKYHNKHTTFSAAYNEEGITFNFNCEDDDIFSTMTKFNDNIFDEDVVEVFISTDGDLKKYFEIEISPLENVLQLKVKNDLNGHFSIEYLLNDVIKRTIIKDSKGWKAEFFIPFTLLETTAKKGDKWLFNAYRIDRNGAGRNFYALNPTFKAEYHHPKYFTELIFG